MKRSILAAVAVLAGSLVTMAPAAAGESATGASSGTRVTSAAARDRGAEIFAPCIRLAARADAVSWTCTAAGLTVTRRDADGRLHRSFTPVASVSVGSDSDSTRQDDYDTWCENQGVCHRNPFGDRFLEETKGNATYGSGPEVIGSFDIIIRTRLNGRQAQWRESFIWDSGPGVSFEAVYANCWEAIDFWPDLSCGNHYGGSRRIAPGAARWNTGTLYGNRLVNAADYYGAVTGVFTTDDDPATTRFIAPLETTRFQCPRARNCVFY